jgi:hypothetical protein
VGLPTKRLILFTALGGIVPDGAKGIQICIEYLEDLSQKTKNLAKKGLSVTAIREELIGEKNLFSQVNRGRFCAENLIKSIP